MFKLTWCWRWRITQLKQADQARAALAKGAEIERTKLPKLESGDIGQGWLDYDHNAHRASCADEPKH